MTTNLLKIIKNLKHKKVIIGLVALVFLGILTTGVYYFNNVRTFQKLVSNADTAVTAENYNEGITLYTEALKYKSDDSVTGKIDLATKLITSKADYESGFKFQRDLKYQEAIDSFKKVLETDTKRYSDCLLYTSDAADEEDSV